MTLAPATDRFPCQQPGCLQCKPPIKSRHLLTCQALHVRALHDELPAASLCAHHTQVLCLTEVAAQASQPGQEVLSLLKVTLPLQCEQPINFIRVDGRSCTIRRSNEHYAAIESQSGMIPWNGKQDNLIDRFDGRALLDFYREPARQGSQTKSEDQQELDEVRRWQQAPAALSCCRG